MGQVSLTLTASLWNLRDRARRHARWHPFDGSLLLGSARQLIFIANSRRRRGSASAPRKSDEMRQGRPAVRSRLAARWLHGRRPVLRCQTRFLAWHELAPASKAHSSSSGQDCLDVRSGIERRAATMISSYWRNIKRTFNASAVDLSQGVDQI
jgi:hypothetical protein